MDEKKRSTDTGMDQGTPTYQPGQGGSGGGDYQPGQGGSGGGGYQPGQSEMPGGQTYHPREDQPKTEEEKGTGTPESES